MSKRKRLPFEREALRRGREEARRAIAEERAREPLLVEHDALMAEMGAARQRRTKWAADHALSLITLLAEGVTCTCGKDCFVCQARTLHRQERSLMARYMGTDSAALAAAEHRASAAISRALGQPEDA